MTDPGKSERWIDDLLDDVAGTSVPDPSVDLMTRVLADAEAALPVPGGSMLRETVLAQVLRGLGGWFSVGGMAAATAVGFAIGLGALNGTALDPFWLNGFVFYYDDSLGLSANGWDLEEG